MFVVTAAILGGVALVLQATGHVPSLAGTGAPSADALLYAVPVGNACVIGYQSSRGGSHIVLGMLPDRSCLSA